jgi:hypothetical protein
MNSISKAAIEWQKVAIRVIWTVDIVTDALNICPCPCHVEDTCLEESYVHTHVPFM